MLRDFSAKVCAGCIVVGVIHMFVGSVPTTLPLRYTLAVLGTLAGLPTIWGDKDQVDKKVILTGSLATMMVLMYDVNT